MHSRVPGFLINSGATWIQELSSLVSFVPRTDRTDRSSDSLEIEPRRIPAPWRSQDSRRTVAMPLLVTSASGANGNGFGALLAFQSDGGLRGTFIDDDRIADPRGLAVDPN
jgi:hypothetical protein